MTARLTRWKLPLVIGIAVLVRLFLFFALPQHFDFCDAAGEIHGSVAYDEYAQNLLATGEYGRVSGQPDAGLPPLYSYVLALVYRLFGRSCLAVILAHSLFDALSLSLLYAICRRLFPRRGDWIGALAGLFFALYPYLIFQSLTLNDTALWIFLLHLFVWLLIALRARPVYDRYTLLIALAAGAALGISALARALLPPLALLAALWFLFRLSWRQTLLRLLPVALMSVLVLLPWLWRGYSIYGGFVPIALNGGGNLYQGNNRWTAAVFRLGYDAQWLPALEDAPPKTEPLRRNNALAAAGWRYLRENPAAISELLWLKFQVYWSAEIRPSKNLRRGERLVGKADGTVEVIRGAGSHVGVTSANAAYAEDSLFGIGGRVHALYFGGLWLLAFAGAWLTRRAWRETSLLVFVQVSQTVMYLLFHPSTRYRSPTDPLLFVFSALALVWLVDWWRGRRLRASPEN